MSDEGFKDDLNQYVLVNNKKTTEFPRPYDGRVKGFTATMTTLAWHIANRILPNSYRWLVLISALE